MRWDVTVYRPRYKTGGKLMPMWIQTREVPSFKDAMKWAQESFQCHSSSIRIERLPDALR